jgi:hypothetical protein
MRLDVDDRGQIVLVGAVAIAFIVIGLVLVANTVLFTESVGSQASLTDVDRASATEKRVQTDVASLTYRVNRLNAFGSQSGLNGSLAANLSTYANLTAAVQFQERGVVQDVTWNRSASEYGVRIEQDDTGGYNASGSNSWDPVPSGTPANVSDFQATFNVSGMTTPGALSDVFSVEYTGSGGAGTSVEVFVYYDDGNVSLYDTTGAVGGIGSLTPSAACTEMEASPRLFVDFTRGVVPGTGCTFQGIGSLDGPVTVEYTDGDEAWGTYEFVTDEPALTGVPEVGPHTGSDSDSPFYAHVLWAVGLDFQYQGPEATYGTTNTVPIYGNASRAAP